MPDKRDMHQAKSHRNRQVNQAAVASAADPGRPRGGRRRTDRPNRWRREVPGKKTQVPAVDLDATATAINRASPARRKANP